MKLLPSSTTFNASSLPKVSSPLLQISKTWDASEKKECAAVCLLFIPPAPSEKEARLVLTKRSLSVKTHKGQISFPGGRVESGDLGPCATAKRETWEEIGIPEDKIECLGLGSPHISIDRSLVWPVIAATSIQPENFHINNREVDELIIVPWSTVSRNNAERFSFNLFGVWRDSYLYQAGPHKIWGLTAKILTEVGLH